MKNPFRTEAEAFKLVWLTIIYFALIVIASVINKWLGLGVFIGETAILIWWILTRGTKEQPIPQSPAAHPAGERRILVIANETVGGSGLLDEIRRRAEGVSEKVLIVSPALNSPIRHWVSDEDQARAAAQRRLDDSLAAIRAAGIEASGEIGDADPLQAIEDALRTFAPDEIVISTHPEGRSNWLERGVVDRARERVTIPVRHVVVDLEAEGATPAETTADGA